MCGRYSLRLNRNEIQELLEGYDVDVHEWQDEEAFVPRYNIAPRTQVPVIRHRSSTPDAGGNSDEIIMQTMKWGLVPHWSKFEDKTLNTTNARSENLVQSGGMWHSIKGRNRCAIPCQGYYEWLTKGKEKLPYFTKRKDNKLLLLAGLYDCVVLDGKPLWTCSIVTTDANKDFSWLHDRQPVFLTNHHALMRWLDTSSQTWTPELTKMVQPYSDTSVPLECYAVPKEVGKVGIESPNLIEPVATRKDGIKAMFSKQERASSPAKPIVSPQKRKLEHDASSPSNEHAKSEHEDGPSHPNKHPKFEDSNDTADATMHDLSSPKKGMEKPTSTSPKKSKVEKMEDRNGDGSSPSTHKSSTSTSSKSTTAKAKAKMSPKKGKGEKKESPTKAKVTLDSFFGKA